MALVKNQLLSLLLLGFISKQFMNITKILNVNIMVIWEYIWRKWLKKFKCDTCGKSFSHSHHLRVRIKTIHECKKDFTCDSCQKLFCHSHHLRENNHEDQKDFKCDTCAKLFSHSHHLRVHIKTIFECQKDFKCDSFLNSKY